MIRRLAVLALLLFAASAFAQTTPIAVDPPDPTSIDDVTLLVQQVASCPPPPTLTRSGTEIVVTLGAGICTTPPVNITWPIDLGVLPAGTYNVSIAGGNDKFSFTVLDATGVQVQQSIGSADGGTPVNVIVAGIFCQGKAVTACAPPAITFGGLPATNVSVIDFSHFTATTPAHAPGAVQVAVTGDSIARFAYSFRYYDPMLPPSLKFFDMVLVPVILNAPAANGSNWVTDVSVRNDNDYTVAPWHPLGSSTALLPGTPFRFGPETIAPFGIFLVVPRQASAGLGFHTMVRDTSRSASDWGTEIPLVHDSEFSTRNLELLDIPVDPRYRAMLRVYANQLTTTGGARAGVSVYSMDDGHELRAFYLPLQGTTFCITTVSCADFPLYAAASDLTNNLQAQRIGVRIQSYTPIWGFVTITNNDTQHVTVITPH